MALNKTDWIWIDPGGFSTTVHAFIRKSDRYLPPIILLYLLYSSHCFSSVTRFRVMAGQRCFSNSLLMRYFPDVVTVGKGRWRVGGWGLLKQMRLFFRRHRGTIPSTSRSRLIWSGSGFKYSSMTPGAPWCTGGGGGWWWWRQPASLASVTENTLFPTLAPGTQAGKRRNKRHVSIGRKSPRGVQTGDISQPSRTSLPPLPLHYRRRQSCWNLHINLQGCFAAN